MASLDNRVNNRGHASSLKNQPPPLHKSTSTPQTPAKSVTGSAGGFQKGQVIKGEIIDLRGKDVKIQLDDARIIPAKIDGNLNVSIGDRATFQITDTSITSMSLKMLSNSYSLSIDYMIEKALDEAGLPHTERNATAVKVLLENQLSINKTGILHLLKQVSTFKNASLGTLALMNRLDMPINQITTSQFEAYRNFEHRIMNQLDSYSDAVLEDNPSPELANQLIQILAKDMPDIYSVNANQNPVNTIISSEEGLNLTELLDSLGITEHEKISLLSGGLSISDTANVILNAIEHTKLNEQLALVIDELDTEAELIQDTDTESKDLRFPAAVNRDLLIHLPDSLQRPEVYTVLEQFIQTSYEQAEIITFLSLSEREHLLQALAPAELMESAKEIIRNGEIPAKELLPVFSRILNSNEENAKQLTQNPSYKSIMKELLLSHWTLTPKSLTKPDAIEEYYKKLEEELSELEKHDPKTTQNDSDSDPSFKGSHHTASGVRDNIDFMKTLNQMFAYFQMPLKLSGQNAHSELYVYTNKKNRSQNQDEIRVLLHLDMTHLGSLDVHIELNAKNVVAKFYLEQNESAPIVKDNLPILSKALENKGFTHNFEVLKREKEIDIVEDFIAPKDPGLDMKRYTFDIRA